MITLRSFLCIASLATLIPQQVTSFHSSLVPIIIHASASQQQQQQQQMALFSSNDSDDIDDNNIPEPNTAINVLGTPLQCCCADVGGTGVGTGFYRNGYCSTGEQDVGRHTVCVQVTDDFLAYSQSVGNDLSTKVPEYLFPGLKEGDIWCLCAERWWQAFQAGKAPQVFLQATHEKTLSYVPYEILRGYALDADEADQRLEDLNAQRSKLNKLLE